MELLLDPQKMEIFDFEKSSKVAIDTTKPE